MGSYLLAIRLVVGGKTPSPPTHPLTHSSVGESVRLLPGRSQVRVLLGHRGPMEAPSRHKSMSCLRD